MRMRKCERNSSADTEVREEGGGDAKAETPLQPMVQTMVRQDTSSEVPYINVVLGFALSIHL